MACREEGAEPAAAAAATVRSPELPCSRPPPGARPLARTPLAALPPSQAQAPRSFQLSKRQPRPRPHRPGTPPAPARPELRRPPCPTRAARSSAGRIVRSPTPRRPASPLRARFSPSPGPGPAQCAAPPGGLRRGKNHASLSLGECPYPAPSCRDEASASLATLRMITMAAAAAVVRAPWQEARAPCLKTVLSGL